MTGVCHKVVLNHSPPAHGEVGSDPTTTEGETLSKYLTTLDFDFIV